MTLAGAHHRGSRSLVGHLKARKSTESLSVLEQVLNSAT